MIKEFFYISFDVMIIIVGDIKIVVLVILIKDCALRDYFRKLQKL
jgi:hypothetical protein